MSSARSRWPTIAATLILACSDAASSEPSVDPKTLRARLDHAVALARADEGDCEQNQLAAQRELQSILDAPPHALVMTPELTAVATGVLANTKLNQAACTDDDAKAETLLLDGLDLARKAFPLLEATREYADLAATRYNIAYALYELGETEAAFEELHKTLALNEKYGQRDDQVENYRTMLEWQSPEGEADESQVDRYAGSLAARRVRFQFAWQPFDATVTSESFRDVYRNDAVQSSQTSVESVLQVRAHGDDLVMTTQVVDASSRGGGRPEDAGALLEKLSREFPPAVISRSGEIKSLGDVDAFVSGLVEELVELSQQQKPAQKAGTLAPDEMRHLAESMLNPQRIERAIRDDWDAEVGTWVGAELEHGAWYEAELESRAFGATSQTIRNKLRFSVTQFVPCAASDRDQRCVEVLMHNSPDEASVRAATEALLSHMLPGRSDVSQAVRAAVDAIELLEVHTRLVTDPSTLRPYVREEVRLARGSVEENGRRNVVMRRDRRVETFSYGPPAER